MPLAVLAAGVVLSCDLFKLNRRSIPNTSRIHYVF